MLLTTEFCLGIHTVQGKRVFPVFFFYLSSDGGGISPLHILHLLSHQLYQFQ